MAIVKQLLADFETPSGQRYRIEYNENGYIHLHTDHVRIDFTPEEFEKLASVVLASRDELISMKDEL